jgi:MOSC domain-containing protein YiiM
MRIISIHVGKPKPVLHQGKELETGIYKSPVASPIRLARLNFEGDGQADLEHHGGPDKAVCVYCEEHYPYWEKELRRSLNRGAFGENVTVQGMTEAEVCIGDIYRLGEAVVQISQPRQPCFKLGMRHDVADLPVKVQTTGFTGYYFRVLEEGTVASGSEVKLLERHPAGITVAYANRIKYHEKKNREGIERILSVKELSDSWRASLISRLASLDSGEVS